MQKNSLKIGNAGEHLACYYAIMEGFDAHRVSGQRKFDVLVEDSGLIFRVQVKTSRYRDKNKKNLTFQLRRRTMDYKKKKSIGIKYGREIDLYAFVSPDYVKVAWMPVVNIVNSYKINIKEEDFNKYTIKDAMETLKRFIVWPTDYLKYHPMNNARYLLDLE